jgi:DNA-binding NtrC family response regulator
MTGFSSTPSTQIQSEGGLVAALTERRCQLVVLNGPEEGTVREVTSPSFRVGKDDADLVLSHATVSRHHFEIVQQAGAYVIRDLGSTNGTWIDQFRVKEAYLRPGVVVRAGEVQLRFESIYRQVDVSPATADRFGPLVGKSVRMRQIFALLDRVAKTDATVVILGETGSGKSAIARAVHEASARANGPFVTVDCGAIAENLIESELFGHEKGSFTGATKARQGALEQAQGGTLFIDELVDLPLHLQPRLLRVLEEREVRRVGGNDAISLDVRIIAASRKDLWREVEAGRFREDLYFRLAVFTIPLPALRERAEDIPALAAAFAESIPGGERFLARLTPEVAEALQAHSFFGNVRELRNVVERAIYLDGDPRDFLGPTQGAPLEFAAAAPAEATQEGAPVAAPEREGLWQVSAPLPASELGQAAVGDDAAVTLVADCTQPFKHAKEALLERFEKEYLLRLLARDDASSASAMARAAGIDRKHLYTLAKKHDVDLKKS